VRNRDFFHGSVVMMLVLLAAFPGRAVWGQSTSASMSGRITDATGAAVPEVDVEIKSVDTASLQHTRSNGQGFYSFPAIEPGNYLMSVHKQSFRSVSVTGITLNLQDNLSRNFVLQVGSTSESITVTGNAVNVNTIDASVSTVIDQTYIKNMPLNGRSFQDLILLTPGVTTNSLVGSGQLGQNGEFSVNGQRTESNYYTVDGVSANTGVTTDNSTGMLYGPAASGSVAASTALGTTQALVSVDDLQEFRVQSSTYSAQYGRNPGGQFAFETKSGTNQWHGTAFEYLRNNAFDANDWFNDFYGVPQPALRQNNFGGTLGGPVHIPHLYDGKDKTFFFVSYEGLRLTQPQEASDFFVPDNCMRGVAGACAGLIGPTGNPRAPAAAALLPVINTFPLQTVELDPVNGFGEFVGSWSNPGSINSTSVRFDHVFNDKMTLFFRFSDTNSNSQSRQAPQEVLATPFLTRTYTVGTTNLVSNHLSNELRFNYTSTGSTPGNFITSFGGNTPINLVSYLNLPATASPFINLNLNGNGLNATQGVGSNQQKQWNIVDTVGYSVGSHQFKFGVDYRRLTPLVVPASPSVFYAFPDEPSVESGTYGQGTFNSGSTVSVQAPVHPLYTNFSAFAQDDWKATQHLTVSLGLRWEVNPPPGVTQGPLPYTIVGTNPSNYALAPYGTSLWRTTWFNFAPRLGAAYQLRTAPGWETVVRGGGGVFFDTGQEDGSISFQGPGYIALSLLSSGVFTTSAPAIPVITSPPSGEELANIYGFSPHLQLPYTLQWNLSVQQALGASQALTISYVGSHGSRLLQENQSIAVSNPNPNIASAFLVQNGLTSDYDGLQAQFQRKLSGGLTVLASYTWSHCIDWGSAAFNIQYLRGDCDFDVRQNLSAAASYSLPSVRGNKLIGAVLSHWGIDDRFTARTAFPVFLIGTSIFNPATGLAEPGYYDTVPGQPLYLSGSTCDGFFAPLLAQFHQTQCPGGRAVNPCAFYAIGGPAYPLCPNQNPTTGGLAPRNELRGFDAVEMDLAVRREFPIHEKVKLQFRAEAFNVFNHPNFGNVASSGIGFGLAENTLATALGVLAPQYQMGGPRSMQFALKLVF